MKDFFIGENPKLWSIIQKVQTKPLHKNAQLDGKTRRILVCGISPNKFNKASSCIITEQIWYTLQSNYRDLETKIRDYNIEKEGT